MSAGGFGAADVPSLTGELVSRGRLAEQTSGDAAPIAETLPEPKLASASVLLAGLDQLARARIRRALGDDERLRLVDHDDGELRTAVAEYEPDLALIAQRRLPGEAELRELAERFGHRPIVLAALDDRDERAERPVTATGAPVAVMVGSPEGLRFVLRLAQAGLLRLEREPPDPLARLTPQQREVADRLLAGASPSQIAEELNLERNTIREYRRRIYGTLGVKDRAALVELLQAERTPASVGRFAQPRPLGCRRLGMRQRNWMRPSRLHMGTALGSARWRRPA